MMQSACQAWVTPAEPVGVVAERLKSVGATARKGWVWSMILLAELKTELLALWASEEVGFLALNTPSSIGHVFPGGKHTAKCPAIHLSPK